MQERERINYLRKEKLKMTMEKFGAAIGISKAAVSRIESGIVSLTEQNRKAICREFSVSEQWLRYGDGEIFACKNNEERIRHYVALLDGISDDVKSRLKNLIMIMDESDWEALHAILNLIQEESRALKEKQ